MSQFPMTTSAVVKTFMFPITWPPTTCPSLSERAALRFPSSARVPTSETISCPPSTSIIWLIKTKSIAKKVIMFLYYNLSSYYRPRGKKNWCGAGGWSKKLKHWLTVTGNFNTQNRFCMLLMAVRSNMWGSGGRFPQSLIHISYPCGFGGLLDKVLYTLLISLGAILNF